MGTEIPRGAGRRGGGGVGVGVRRGGVRGWGRETETTLTLQACRYHQNATFEEKSETMRNRTGVRLLECFYFIFKHPTIGPSLLSKDGRGKFNACSDQHACCSHEGKTSLHKTCATGSTQKLASSLSTPL